MSVPQSGDSEAPEVLKHFQHAVLRLGEVVPHNSQGMWHWRSRSFEEGVAVLGLIWSQLGRVKRDQAARAVIRFLSQYSAGRFTPRPPRRRRPTHAPHRLVAMPAPGEDALDRAWVAGFLDGEGCFGLVRSKGARKDDPAWHRIRVSVTQRSDLPGPPEVLFRLKRVLAFGRIERHGDPHAYKWVAEGAERVELVLASASPWLGSVKAAQARLALEAFRSQARLKGDAERCVRGHAYTRVALKGGRLRRVCNACARLLDRRDRARRGIPPRRFKNVARRYTS